VADLASEKNTRSAIKAAVDRAMSREAVVICDYMNFVKGYRYELFCISRAAGTQHCVVLHLVFYEVAESRRCFVMYHESKRCSGIPNEKRTNTQKMCM